METPRTCRSCGGVELQDVLDLGEQPLANELPPLPDASQTRFRLNFVCCRNCTLAQIDESVEPNRLFGEYLYCSSYSDTMVASVHDLADRTIRSRCLDGGSLVIEAGSNDGYLLKFYKESGIPVLGVEPAENIAHIARSEHGVRTEVAFFDASFGAALAARGLRCDIFHAHNVLAHVPDPNTFFAGIAHVLKPDGAAIIEAPYVRDLLQKLAFDTIYHEHFSYFGVTAVDNLARRNSLALVDVARLPIHGGSLRYVLAPAGTPQQESVANMMAEESDLFDDFQAFSNGVSELCKTLRKQLVDIKARGGSVAAYGAAAKGSTLLNAIGIDRETIDFTVDRNPLKQGRFMPGVGIPIVSPDILRQRRPDFVLMLAWNLADEVLRQQSMYLEAGGVFLIPIPSPSFVDKHGETRVQ